MEKINQTGFFNFLGITFQRFILIIIIIFITIIVERLIRIALSKSIKKSSRLIKVDPTRYAILKYIVSILIYLIGISISVYMIPPLRGLAVSFLAGAGVLAIIIGFAAQHAFSNLVSGIFIALSEPFRIGDWIKVGSYHGIVEDITLRHTVIRNFENKRIIIPNATMTNETIENFNIIDNKICKFVEFGISYDSDVNKAIKIIQQEALKHPNFLDVRKTTEKRKKEPPVRVKVIGYGDSSVNLRAWVWAKDPKSAYRMGWDLNKSIKERFDKEGVEIPFPYRTIVYKKDLERKNNKSKK